ncbi:Bug family tripartite tricarboxylate transporter substrate binding protein [Ramlibacter pallidus]|uniref:Tripartite tricarboxylate transporter substrate binding protein n=1 Tax=Ramlibacter pallidus TaxID=2780087 RepID=A0ABR9S083_9BURK|nr:tripartite tricarboxylate transporter substrate binding protein [Ramlibacter pallidus]MBE7366712.1 tripartite tricarboxylate transporter substrate binding protein [Ramlibacter pallidus]
MTPIPRRAFLAAGAAAALPAFAQQPYPSKPVRIVVPYPPGGVSDAVARALGEKLAAQMGQPFVIDNKAGASGTIGVDAVAKSAPDGHTLAFTAISPLVLSPHLGKVPYDPATQVTPVVSVMYSPVLLLATPALAARDFRELLEMAKAKPRAVRWATSGSASLGHLMLEQLQEQARVEMVHFPYKGGGQQMTDALSGQFEVLSTNAGPAVSEHIKAGKLRPLAVGAPKRLESLPNVPTLAELGYAGANLSSQFGIVAPGGLPRPTLEKINAQVNAVLQMPDIRSRLVATDNVPTGGSAEAFAKQIAAESAANLRIIRAVGIKVD